MFKIYKKKYSDNSFILVPDFATYKATSPQSPVCPSRDMVFLLLF